MQAAQGQVRPPGELAGLQVRGAELRAAPPDRSTGGADRRGGFGLPDQAGIPAQLRAAFADPWIGFVQAPQDYRGWHRPPTTAACTTPTSTFSPSLSRHATNATGPSSPALWASSGGWRWTNSAAGTSGASPRTPNCRCGCCEPAGQGCTWISPWVTASCH